MNALCEFDLLAHAQRLRRLSDLGDQLEAYGRVVDFELFRPEQEGRAYEQANHH